MSDSFGLLNLYMEHDRRSRKQACSICETNFNDVDSKYFREYSRAAGQPGAIHAVAPAQDVDTFFHAADRREQTR